MIGNIHDFIEAALPWIAIAVAVAVSFSKDAKKEYEREK